MQIRLARPSDAAAVAAIYAPHVSEGVASFEVTPPTEAEMAERIRRTVDERPWLVYEDGGMIWGYAYAARHRERLAYQWSVETSVYVHRQKHRAGVGRASHATHPVGVYRHAGFKLGRWWDVGWWQKSLCAHTVPVDAPMALAG